MLINEYMHGKKERYDNYATHAINNIYFIRVIFLSNYCLMRPLHSLSSLGTCKVIYPKCYKNYLYTLTHEMSLVWSGMPAFSWPNLLVVSKTCETVCFQLFDIWWSGLDKMNDFKSISRMRVFHFSKINRSLFLVDLKVR